MYFMWRYFVWWDEAPGGGEWVHQDARGTWWKLIMGPKGEEWYEWGGTQWRTRYFGAPPMREWGNPDAKGKGVGKDWARLRAQGKGYTDEQYDEYMRQHKGKGKTKGQGAQPSQAMAIHAMPPSPMSLYP